MPEIKSRHGAESIKAKIRFMAEYKFSICFENTSTEYYLTEKLGDALYVGSVPIYWGCPKVAEYFNPDAFINCHDYDSFEEVIDRVIEVDNDPELYRKYRDAPPVLSNSRFYVLQEEIPKHYAKIIKETLRRRNKKHGPLTKMRHCLWMAHLYLQHVYLQTVVHPLYIPLVIWRWITAKKR